MAKYESITDIEGIYAGHATNEEGGTGCTVIVCPAGATGGVDVRGGAPATRETDLLRPEETVQVVHAVSLSGGSAFGLAATCGIADELERRDIGFDVGVAKVPIVCGASVFDLSCGRPDVRPTADDGAAAVAAALDRPAGVPLERGNVGSGTGCTVGKVCGMSRCMKTGFGESVRTCGELVCGAVAAVNALGNVVDPASGENLAGVLDESLTHIIDGPQALLEQAEPMPLRTNTTISCVVTNANLTKAQATKVAQMCADAYAHAIRPTHTTADGDTVFVMATGAVDAAPDVVGVLATEALEGAIVDAALSATDAHGLKSARSLRRNESRQ